jgi:glycosyltransferase involved in cell wall biosynthesis
MKPLISVIMAACNAEQTIGESVDSLRAQTYEHFELLIVSDDMKSYEKLKKNDNRIKFLSTGTVKAGPSSARNIGLSHARCDYVVALDSDDVMLPTRLEELLPLAQEFNAATDNTVSIDFAIGKTLGCLFQSAKSFMAPEEAMAIRRPMFPLFKREILAGWDNSLRFAEDFIFNMQAVIQAGGMAVCSKALLQYRVHSNSMSHSVGSHITADSAYTYMLQRLRRESDGFGLSLEWREKLIAVVEAKKRLNLDFSYAFQNGECKNFSDFLLSRSLLVEMY